MLEADLTRLTLGPLFLICLLVVFYLRERKAARLFMVIGVLHVLGGLWVGREPLLRIFREGFLGEADSGLGNVPPDADKELLFWFVLWGVFTFVLGQLLSWMERHGQPPPAWLGWELVVINLFAAALMPKGGFWLVLIPSFLIIRESRRPQAP
ncbi:MAG TPA: DUF6463 family protein [Thermoanaerobaculia bacterium]|nr:DUF6463 family protein [Thermoanaerobaculia bacterium]